MKRIFVFIMALLPLALVGCVRTQGDDAGAPVSPETVTAGKQDTGGSYHSHQPYDGNNIVEHEEAGYCGNTVTTVSFLPMGEGNEWEKSFWGDDSVALTDLLRYLDYSGEICRCLPEYVVDTEFGQGYGINLSQGYARYGDGQAELTSEQIEDIRDILDRVSKEI